MSATPIVRHVLVPVDFSKYAEAALLWAVRLADLIGAEMTVLHIVHDPGEAPGFYAQPTDEKDIPTLEEVATEMMQEFIGSVMSKHSDGNLPVLAGANTVLQVGLPVTRILEVSENIGADLIVMGSQGRTGLSHMLLGSKAEQTVRLSRIPVTIVKTPL